jgi:hypothetical protein
LLEPANYRAARKNHPESTLAHECFIATPTERAKSTLFAPAAFTKLDSGARAA